MEQLGSCDDYVARILSTIEELNRLKDVDAILDKTLAAARALADAEAGSIFLVEDGRLAFRYVHNDILFADGSVSPAMYKSFTLPIDETSIVGYAAQTGQPLAIDDAYALDESRPYRFNKSFDESTGFRTRSILTLPLKTFDGKLVGVMQVINARDQDGVPGPFSLEQRTYIPLFAQNAAVAIERGRMTREMILRMMRMAELRDPTETATHVQRVGAYAAEIYHRWALDRGVPRVPREEIRRFKDLLRIAAMLHDVGKVGVSDTIIKKPSRLSDDEFMVMKRHTIYGARLFADCHSDLDELCRDIALRHHEQWAGGGYPGRVDDLLSDHAPGLPIKGEDIPLAARITSLADVYDALVSPRSYKEPWPEEKVLDFIREKSGVQFDPGVVDAFFKVHEVLLAIRERFAEPG